MSGTIAIVDYGMGNLRSVQKGLAEVGWEAVITGEPAVVLQSRGVILPGVGAFGEAMANLNHSGLTPALREVVASTRPLLGICLGLQLLFEESEEDGYHRGLGLLKGRVRRLPAELKVPHMGWNQVDTLRPCPLFQGVPPATPFYFVHSYYVEPVEAEVTVATTTYGRGFAAAVARGHLFGVQFHPEKSSHWGLQVLKNFGELVAGC